jgi:hypothetical protein
VPPSSSTCAASRSSAPGATLRVSAAVSPTDPAAAFFRRTAFFFAMGES